MIFLRSGWCWPGNGGNGPQRSRHCSQGTHALRIEEATGQVVIRLKVASLEKSFLKVEARRFSAPQPVRAL